jgi:hypothetical protein
MIQNNEGLNTARLTGNNGTDWVENGTITAKTKEGWFGFQPHNAGCKVTAVTIKNAAGDSITTETWVNSTLDLDSFISASLVKGAKGYITSITVTGACTLYRDTISK